MRPHPVADAGRLDALPGARVRRWLVVLWPAFLMAGVLETLVFVVVDPAALHGLGGAPLDWPAMTVYSIAFLVFWAVIAASTALTQLLDRPA